MPLFWFLWYRLLLLPLMWLATYIGALVNDKWRQRLTELRRTTIIPPAGQKPRLWIHAASMGEFEQVLSVATILRQEWSIVASFTSPSGLHHGGRMSHLLDASFLLPIDTPAAMRRLVDMVAPTIVLYSRYDIWPMMQFELSSRGIPTVLINATTPSRLTGPLRSFYASVYRTITSIFAVDADSAQALANLVGRTVPTLSDTRYDRVLIVTTSHQWRPTEGCVTVVFGSVWEKDLDILNEVLHSGLPDSLRIIVVPHEPTEPAVQRVMDMFNVRRCSSIEQVATIHEHVVIDTVGVLLQLYGIAHAAYVGGGFGFNVHSVAEPAAYMLPVACGPNINRSVDATVLSTIGGVTIVKSSDDLRRWLDNVVMNEAQRMAIGAKSRQWLENHAGSSEYIAHEIASLAHLANDAE